jgi:periplasmic protein TonB
METTRYSSGGGVRPDSLILSGGVVALMLTGMIFAAPNVASDILKAPPLITYRVPPPPEPQPQPKPKPKQRLTKQTSTPPRQTVDQPPVVIDTVPSGPVFTAGDPVTVDPPPGTGAGVGNGTALEPAPPIFVEPVVDPRYARDFQPPYPADQQREGREGLVKVRVLIGTDGRVKAVEPVSTASDSFLDATRRHALARWRFRPATRDGVPIERWRLMRVNFVLTEE